MARKTRKQAAAADDQDRAIALGVARYEMTQSAQLGHPIHAIEDDDVDWEMREGVGLTPEQDADLERLIISIRTIGRIIEPVALQPTGRYICAVPECGFEVLVDDEGHPVACPHHTEDDPVAVCKRVAGKYRLTAYRYLDTEEPGRNRDLSLREPDEIGKWERIPATYVDGSELDMWGMALAENIIRKAPTAIELAGYCARMMKRFGITRQDEFGEAVGLHKSTVTRLLRPERLLSDTVKDRLREMQATIEVAYLTTHFETEEEQLRYLAAVDKLRGPNMGLRAAARQAKQELDAGYRWNEKFERPGKLQFVIKAPHRTTERPTKSVVVAELEKLLAEIKSGELDDQFD